MFSEQEYFFSVSPDHSTGCLRNLNASFDCSLYLIHSSRRHINATFLKVGVHPASEVSRQIFWTPLFGIWGYNWKLQNEKTITRNIVKKLRDTQTVVLNENVSQLNCATAYSKNVSQNMYRYIEESVHQWRMRLRACRKVKGITFICS